MCTTIRRYEILDSTELMEMMKKFYNSSCVIHKIPSKNMELTLSYLNQGSPFTTAFIIRKSGIVAGYVLLSFTYSNEAGGTVVWIEEIYVKENFRSMHLGTKLIDYVIEEYPTAARFRIDMVKDNKASLGLFKSFSFEKLEYLQFIRE